MNTPSPSVAGSKLLAQHRMLRGLLDATLELAHADDAAGSARQVELVAALAEQLEEHNRIEEQVLEPLLRTADAWGPDRIARMLDHHRQERAALLDELRHLTTRAAPDRAASIVEFVAALRRHIDLEERDYLNTRVLRDDVVALDASGG